jgi:DNA-binding CsgD family transcriptional regulator
VGRGAGSRAAIEAVEDDLRTATSRIPDEVGGGFLASEQWRCRCGQVYRLSITQLDPVGDVFSDDVALLPDAGSLSDFQMDVLALIANGRTDNGVAQALGVSVHRVRYAVRDLVTRLSAHSRAEAVFIAVRHGFLGAKRPRIPI